MNLDDQRVALFDAILIRAGQKDVVPHPLAEQLLDDRAHLIKDLAENIGASLVMRGNDNPNAAFIAGITSDKFRNLLARTAQMITIRRLEAHAGHRAFCDLREVVDFKDETFPSVDIDMELVETNELGAIDDTIMLMVEEGLVGRVKTYGKNINITRQVIINDQIELLASLFANAGSAAARKEATLVYELLESNPVLSDGELMFHLDHGNVVDAGLSEGLADAMAKLRTMRTPAGAFADLSAAYLVVSPYLEFTAQSLVESNGLDIKVISSPWLPDWRWYLSADPELSPAVAILHLRGSQGGLTIGQLGGKYKKMDGVSLGVRFETGAVAVGRVGIVRGGV